MCFSAAGSFTATVVLAGIGTASVARNKLDSWRLFSAIPLIFAGQQAAEGIVWLTVGSADDAALNRLAANTFLGVALVLWPLYLPVALRRMEEDPFRRTTLTRLCWLGGIVAATALVMLMRTQPVASIAGHSIRYDYAGSEDATLGLIQLGAYVTATVVPFFVTTVRSARWIGVALMASFALVVMTERDTLTSVWCFFAAIVSALILAAVAMAQPRLEEATAT